MNGEPGDLAAILADLADEVDRQDTIHPAGYPATRDGLRLGISALEDEVLEVWEEHRAARRTDGWGAMETELLQVAGVAVRMLRSLGRQS